MKIAMLIAATIGTTASVSVVGLFPNSSVAWFTTQTGVDDQGWHVLAYFVITALMIWSVAAMESPALKFWKHTCLALALVGAIGAANEFLQIFAGRTCSLDDWLANMAGAAIALPPAWLIVAISRTWRSDPVAGGG